MTESFISKKFVRILEAIAQVARSLATNGKFLLVDTNLIFSLKSLSIAFKFANTNLKPLNKIISSIPQRINQSSEAIRYKAL